MSASRELLEAVRVRFPLRTVAVGHDVWGVRDTVFAEDNTTGAVPLLLLHGALGSSDMFYRVVDTFAPSRRVLALNLPDLPSAALLAYSLAALLRQLELPRVDLLGTSLGGYVAQRFAIGHPERLRRLVLSNSFHDPGPLQRRWPAPADYDRYTAAEVVAASRAWLRTRREDTPAWAELKQLLMEVVGGSQSGACIKALRMALLTATALPPLPLPPDAVVLIDSPNDSLAGPLTRAKMALRYAGSRHFSIEGGDYHPGHLQPEAYLAAVREALDG